MNAHERLLVLLGAAMASTTYKSKLLAGLPVDDVPIELRDVWTALSTGDKLALAKYLGVVADEAKPLIDTVLEAEQEAASTRFCERQTFVLSHVTGQEYLDTLDAIRSRVAARVAAVDKGKDGETK